jgi:hypothetical protein
VVALALPSFQASVEGTRSTGEAYAVTWALLGYESAAGWLPAVAGALLLSAVATLRRRRRAQNVLVALSSLVALAAYPLLASTPLRTWNRWVPVEIQSEYGTEYAMIAFEAVHDAVRVAAVALGVLAAVLMLAAAYAARPDRTPPVEVTS